jgi:DNA-binding response OmpR family regulator
MPRICRVLVVEDDPDVQEVFNHVLAQEGYELLVAHDGSSMRDALAKSEIDVVVVDVMLPGGENGLALADEAARRGCGVILVTGHHDHYDSVEKSGRHHLFKPFRMEALLAMVDQVLQETEALCATKDKKCGRV